MTVRKARENNLKNVDVAFPLGTLIAVTGASGSGKSSLVNEILYKALWKRLVDTRTLPGEHDGVDGLEHVHKVVNIDQSPIGRNSRSNPATYVGFYDTIRDLFTQAPLSVERGYKPGRFSFNVKGGRCEECQGEGVITTQLYFMPDVEVTCGACKGARFNSETLEVMLRGKTIDDVLNMSIEEGVAFFESEAAVRRKLEVLHALGLGYLTLGQSATTLSGGEAQRVKIATELSLLQRTKHTDLHPRRADDRPAPRRHRASAAGAQPAGGRRAHGDPDRAPSRRDQDGRPRDRSRARRRSRGRRGRGDRDAREGGRLQGVAHGPLPQGPTAVAVAPLARV